MPSESNSLFMVEAIPFGNLASSGGALDGYLYISNSIIDRDGSPNTSQQGGLGIQFNDKDGERIGTIRVDRNANGVMSMKLGVHTDDTEGVEFSEWLEIRADRLGGTNRYLQSTASGFHLLASNIDRDGTAPTANAWNGGYDIRDTHGERIGAIQSVQTPTGRIATYVQALNDNTNNTEVANYLWLAVDKDGTRSFGMSDNNKFCNTFAQELSSNCYMHVQNTLVDRGTTPAASGDIRYLGYNIRDKDLERLAVFESYIDTSGNLYGNIYVNSNVGDGTNSYSGIRIVKELNNKNAANMVYNANSGQLNLYGNLVTKDASFARNTTPGTSDHWAPGMIVQDKDGNSWAQVREIRRTTGRNDIVVGSYGADGTANWFTVGVNPDGTKFYGVSDKNAFRTGIEAMGYKLANNYYGFMHYNGTDESYIRTTKNGLIPYESGGASNIGTSGWPFNWGYFVRLAVIGTGDAAGASAGSPGLTVGDTSGAHLAIDTNEIMAKSSATATGTLNLNIDGGNVVIGLADKSTVNLRGTAQVNGTSINSTAILTSGTIADARLPTKGSAGTAGTSSATSGATLAVPYLTTDAYGRVTAKGTHTHTINSLNTSAISAGTLPVERGGTGITNYCNITSYDLGSTSIPTSTWKECRATTSTTRVTLAAGKWLIILSAAFAANATGSRIITAGTTSDYTGYSDAVYLASRAQASSSGTTKTTTITVTLQTESTTWYVKAWQNSGSAINCAAHVRCVRLG